MAGIATYYAAAPQNNAPPTTVKSYENALTNQGQDYSFLQKQYKDLLDQQASNPRVMFQPIQYQESQDASNAIGNLGDLATTGGYSDAAQQAIRARGISPIKAAYAGANRDVDRQRALQGGFSPNYNAVKAKMAREQSAEIANQITNVNATLAQNIAQNRLAASSPYASAAQNEEGRQLDVSKFNAGNELDVAKLNQGNDQNRLDILKGYTSLYGTTPAAASVFGNQALQAAQLNSNNANAVANRGVAAGGELLSGLKNNNQSRLLF